MTGIASRAVLAAGLAALLSAPASAVERPSFDCSMAVSPTEKAICGNDRLARLDRAIAQAYRKLRADPNLTEELTKEQTAFLARRDTCGADVICLAREMDSRRAALALEPLAANKDAREQFVGRYRNSSGEALIRRTLSGEIELSVSTAERSGRWTCDVWGTLQSVDNKGVATSKGDDDGGTVVVYLKKRGSLLIVTEDLENPREGRACGHNGTVEGAFRRVTGG